MTDNVTLPGTGAVVGADEVTIATVLQKVQRFKQVVGKVDEYQGSVGGRTVDGDADRSANFVDPRPLAKRIQVTPAVSTSPAYTVKDAVGALMTFANAARAVGGSCVIQSVQIEDKSQQMPSLDLVLFDRTITVPTDNVIFNPTASELSECVGVISITSGWADFAANSVAVVNNVGLEVVLNGTDLFGVLVARTTPTFTTVTAIVVTLTILQD